MVKDFVGGIENRNYRIRLGADPSSLRDLFKIISSLLVVAAFLLFYSWVRSSIVGLGYEQQRLQVTEDALSRTQKSLILEVETLRNPERIDGIARNELGMSPLRPSQLVAPQPPNSDLEDTAVAFANVSPGLTDSRKLPATN